ncbi:MAG: L-histidine N(alpha)-methyltransferase [Alphaproteobacteria bacterium]|nr:L-histidine N(alpha)-methyltransferase [Alphaproteobacteria bacterium]
MSPQERLESFDDLAPEPDDFLSDVLTGLSRPQKKLPCKYIYDERGSQLFDQICELPEYYPTRTEMALLAAKGAEIAACVGPSAQIVEYGCGSVQKIRLLLDALQHPVSYVAVDISREHLLNAAAALAEDYPGLEVHALCADFSKPFDVPPVSKAPDARRVGFFPGSTLGNFNRKDAVGFLASAAQSLGTGGGMVIGVDLKKDEALLNAAYNDSQGVTAQFNLNLLERINRELKGDFDAGSFTFRAHYDDVKGRVESYLYSSREQSVRVDGHNFKFDKGESIHTENSHKYSVAEFQNLAEDAGFEHKRVWIDDDALFSIHFLEVAAR